MLHALRKRSGRQRSIIAVPSHRLTTVPKNIFPAVLQDLFSAYNHLLKGFAANNITITDDSAGRNIGE
jgi:acetyl esterase/lipase